MQPMQATTQPLLPQQQTPVMATHQSPTATDPWQPREVDLELEKKWFAGQAYATRISSVPSFLSGNPYTYSLSGNIQQRVLILSTQFSDDLSRSKFRVEFISGGGPSHGQVISAQRIDYPPPPSAPSITELTQAAAAFGENLARYTESMIGTQVGNGECWTLAHDGLAAVPGALSQSA